MRRERIAGKLVLIGLAFVLLSCKDDGMTDSTIQSTNLLPLKVGNSWTFKATHYDTIGVIQKVDTLTFTVLHDTVLIGQQWFLTTTGYYRATSDGVWFLDNDTNPVLLFKSAGSVGDTYAGGTNQNVQIVSKAEKKIVPNGSYTCYHYRVSTINPNIVPTDFYFANDIGWVYCESVAGNVARNEYYLRTRLELIGYNQK